jgi:uncharacterized RDD family membrane protein YckC
VTLTGPPANWYQDPSGGAGLRYWDGNSWTTHVASPHAYVAAPLPWKGYQIGRPQSGPGSLADPGKRLGAWAIDAGLFFVLFVVMATVALLIAAPHFGPIFPSAPANDPNATVPFPGFFWIYFTLLGSAFVASILMVVYETVATAVYGRSLGKKLLHIRPVRLENLGQLGWARAFGRAFILWGAIVFGQLIGLLVPAWCLWDDKLQGLQDKVVDSIVIEDPPSAPPF